jgi:hypothetical protein
MYGSESIGSQFYIITIPEAKDFLFAQDPFATGISKFFQYIIMPQGRLNVPYGGGKDGVFLGAGIHGFRNACSGQENTGIAELLDLSYTCNVIRMTVCQEDRVDIRDFVTQLVQTTCESLETIGFI